MTDEVTPQQHDDTEVLAEDTPKGEGRKMRLNFQDVSPQYANFCAMDVRQGEVRMNFGKTFLPSPELKIDEQIVMSIGRFKQLYEALGRMLEAQEQQDQQQ
jgi:hypothetical protein